MHNFIPPPKLTHDGIEYQFVRDYIVNSKGLRMPSRQFVYLQLNKFSKGRECVFPFAQLKWMIDNPNYKSE